MSQSQLHKAKQSLEKLERLTMKTARRLDNIKRNMVQQQQFLEQAQAKYDELVKRNKEV